MEKYPWIRIEDRKKFVFDIKTFHPDDPRWRNYWYEEIRRTVEGHWAEDFGKYRYMPANLYFTVNHGTIIDTDERENTRRVIRPILWDIMFEYAYQSLVAKGFSGFKEDDKYTCDDRVFTYNHNKHKLDKYLDIFTSTGKFKEYVSPVQYVRMLHDNIYMTPLYWNQTKNTITLGSRGGSKSYWTALGELLHELVTDGIKYYNESNRKNRPSIKVLVGSGDTSKSSELCAKVKDAMNELATNPLLGVYGNIGDPDYTPNPLFKDMSGDISPNNKDNPWRHEYQVEVGGRKVFKGTKSALHHVTYSENKRSGKGAQSGAGGRYNVSVIEEIGLCFAKGTKVRMYDLSIKNIEDVNVGDVVMGQEGLPRTVKITSTGIDDLYKVNQRFGEDYVVNSRHPLYVYEKYKDAGVIDNPERYILIEAKDYNSRGKSKNRETYGIKSGVLNFPSKELEVCPYYIGSWLGDGYSANQNICFDIEKDKEAIEYFQGYAKSCGLSWRLDKDRTVYTGNFFGKKGRPNFLREQLRKYNLLNNKHIPEDFIKNSEEVRLQVLAGIIDTDGYYANAGKVSHHFEIGVSRNEEFVKQVEFLARSLGFTCRTKKFWSVKGFDNKIIPGRYKYRIRISGPIWRIPTKLERKKAVYIEPIKNNRFTPITVTSIGKGEYYGFELEEDPYFLLEDNTVVHNTPLLIGAYKSNDATVRIGTKYFGRQCLIGTSENIEAIQPAKEIFTHPRDYRMIEFEDVWEHTGQIGFYLPAYMTDGRFKDDNGNTDFEEAKKYFEEIRAEKAKASNPEVLRGEKLNYPMIPSEMWLGTKAKILPYEEAAEREKSLMKNLLYEKIGTPVTLTWASSYPNGVKHEVDYSAKPIYNYPIRVDSDNVEGAIMIYSFPEEENGIVPNDKYLAICDTYVSEALDAGGSLGVTFVVLHPKYWHKMPPTGPIVASYIGKNAQGLDGHLENQEKLLAFYGNPLHGLWLEKNRIERYRDHYIKKKKPWILAPTPTKFLSKSAYERVAVEYGIPVSNKVMKLQFLDMLHDLLLQEITVMGTKKRFIETIPCIYTIREIMAYDVENGNFDAVSALLMLPVVIEQIEYTLEQTIKQKNNKNPLSFLSMNSKIYKEEDYRKITQNKKIELMQKGLI